MKRAIAMARVFLLVLALLGLVAVGTGWAQPKTELTIALSSFATEVLDPPLGGHLVKYYLSMIFDYLVGTTPDGQPSRDGGMRPEPAIKELCAVSHLVRERMTEGMFTQKPRRREELGRHEPLERRGELGSGQIDDGAQQIRRHVVPDHGGGLEHVLVAVREPIDARREDDLLQLAAQRAARRQEDR